MGCNVFQPTTTSAPLPTTPIKLKNSRKRSAPTTHPDEKDEKRPRKSRLVYDFKVAFLSQFFHMPQRSAAKAIGVSTITIKRCCKRQGIKWPYRANKYKAGNKMVLSEREHAFRMLPLVCMIEAVKLELEETFEVSDCDTDTESVDEDEQVKKDVCAVLFSLSKTPFHPRKIHGY